MICLIIIICFVFIIQSTISQSSNTCKWGDFSLQDVQGYEIQCIDDTYAYGYTPCMSYTLCNGMRYQAVYFSLTNGQCQYYLAEWDDGETIPQYSLTADNITQYTFNYNNGEVTGTCSQGIEFEINWLCDPDSVPFSTQTTCEQITDCKHTMTVKSAYACTEPPPNDDCIWGNLNLQNVKGYDIHCIENFNNELVYSYTPCMSMAYCNGDRYQSILFNGTNSECVYYLAQWDNGESMPRYIDNSGNPVWVFEYKNGQETQQCSNGIEMEINWICDPECTPYCLDSKCNQLDECSHQMTVLSSLACVVPNRKNKTSFARLLKMQNKMFVAKL
eukprot:52571_1